MSRYEARERSYLSEQSHLVHLGHYGIQNLTLERPKHYSLGRKHHYIEHGVPLRQGEVDCTLGHNINTVQALYSRVKMFMQFSNFGGSNLN